MFGVDMEQVLPPLILSFKTMSVTVLLLLLFGIPLAYLLSFKKLRLKWLLNVLVTLPLIFPPIAVGFFLLLLLGKKGVLGGVLAEFDFSFIFSFSGLVLAAWIAGLPLMVKPLQSAIELFPQEIREASYLSGKSATATLVYVILPTIKRSLLAALIIATARGFGEVGITLMLGGNIIGKTDTVSLAIYNAVFDGDHDLALILSAILVVISLLFFIALHALEKEKI